MKAFTVAVFLCAAVGCAGMVSDFPPGGSGGGDGSTGGSANGGGASAGGGTQLPDSGPVDAGPAIAWAFVLPDGGTAASFTFGNGQLGVANTDFDFAVRNLDGIARTLGPLDAGEGFLIEPPDASVVAAGASASFTVSFRPASVGAVESTLSMKVSSPPTPVQLSGAGACPTLPPADLDAPGMSACTKNIYLGGGGHSLRAISDDGFTWTDLETADSCLLDSMGMPTTQCGFDDGVFALIAAKGLLVAAGDFGIWTSAQGGKLGTWVKAAAPAPQQWNQGVHVSAGAYGNGFFLITGGGTTFKSIDGYVWTKTAGPEVGYMGFGELAFGNGHFVGTGSERISGIDYPRIIVSEDGTTWHDKVGYPSFTHVAYGNGVFLAAGVDNDAGIAFRATSTDGVDWSYRKDDCSADAGADACLGTPGPMAFGNGKFMAIGAKHSMFSPDGVTFDPIHVWTYRKLSAGDGIFIDNGLESTTDGAGWTTHPVPTGYSFENILLGKILK